MATKIDLRPYYELLHHFLRDAVEKHALKNPETVVSTVGFYYAGYNPILYLSLDTEAASKEFLAESPDSYYVGKDQFGLFANSPPDFPIQLGAFEFLGFPDLYEAERMLEFTHLDGSLSTLDVEDEEHGGDEGVDNEMFKFLEPTLKEFSGFNAIRHNEVFRITLRMNSSENQAIWVPLA